MAKHNQMTESKFKAIKLILNGGAKGVEAAKYMQVSEATIYRVKASETFEEYKNMMAAQALAAKQARENARKEAAKAEEQPQTPAQTPAQTPVQVQEVRQVVTVQATRFMEEQMKLQTELLTTISNKLAAIIEDLYGIRTPKEG